MSECADIRPTRVEVDLSAIVANAETVAAHARVSAYAVVKADAYGHGAAPVARALAASPSVAGLAVALVEEGVQLRHAGIDAPILVMGAALGTAHAEIVERVMTPMISRAADLERFAEIGRERGAPVPVHIKVDTGMRRLGVHPDELDALVHMDGVVIAGLCTHLACADLDDPDDPDSTTARQLNRFEQVLAALAADGIEPAVVHAANSAGALFFPSTAAYDRVRPGLALYGNGPRPDGVELVPAMTFATEIVQLRDLAPGDSVSYGGLWSAQDDARIAIAPVGYADGYPRNLTGAGEVLVGGRRCPIVGAVCMDMIVLDVTALGDAVSAGDPIVVLGEQGRERITVREFAERAGISEYEVTCGISNRVPRVYV